MTQGDEPEADSDLEVGEERRPGVDGGATNQVVVAHVLRVVIGQVDHEVHLLVVDQSITHKHKQPINVRLSITVITRVFTRTYFIYLFIFEHRLGRCAAFCVTIRFAVCS